MQSSPARSSSPADTHQRILEAASRVFAREGLAGATTRAIADEAGVNEVTLFRHFQTKDKLLEAVIGRNFGPAPESTPERAAPVPTADLRADLLEHAQRYERLLKQNLPLVRTMLGEIHHRHRDQETQVFRGIFVPVKTALLVRIKLAQEAGELRADIRADILADLFASNIFTGVLRRDAPAIAIEYSASEYLEAAVDVLLHGAVTPRARR